MELGFAYINIYFYPHYSSMNQALINPIADLHIGIEHTIREKGALIPSQTEVMKKKLLHLIDRVHAGELIILGDLKHRIPSLSMHEYREIPKLMRSISDYVDITVVKGNHDGGLDRIIPNISIVKSLEKDGLIFTHGHRWIEKETIDFDTIVLGHSHPAISFEDEFSRKVREPAWIRGKFTESLKDRYNVSKTPDFIVMPAFNPLLTGVPFNSASKKVLGPYFKSGIIDVEDSRVFLLDGTSLGSISGLKAA
jgi:putative SbcD/Mre11-related phosphoesterase